MLTPAAVLESGFAARAFDEYPPHRFCRGSKKMPAIGKICSRRLARIQLTDQPQVCFMDEGRRLQCLAWLLAAELLCCQFAQLVIDQRQELFGGARVARLNSL